MKLRYVVLVGCVLSVCGWLLPTYRVTDQGFAAFLGVSTHDWLSPLEEVRLVSRVGLDDTIVLRYVAYCVIDVLLLIGIVRMPRAWMGWACATWAFFWMIYGFVTTTPDFIQVSAASNAVGWASTVLKLCGAFMRPGAAHRDAAAFQESAGVSPSSPAKAT